MADIYETYRIVLPAFAAYILWDKINRDYIIPQQRNYKLVYTVPHEHLEVTREAIFAAGGGLYPDKKYGNVSFQIPGNGQFKPLSAAGATPHTGTVDKVEFVEELRVEILCVGRDVARDSVAALKKTHPYETVAYEVYKLEEL